MTPVLTRTPVPDLPLAVGLPEGWSAAPAAGVALIAVESAPGLLPDVLTVVHVPERPGPDAASVAEASLLLLAPVLLDVVEVPGTSQAPVVDVLLAHVGPLGSLTSWQRQLTTPVGLVAVTLTVATSRMAEQSELARLLLDSVEVAP